MKNIFLTLQGYALLITGIIFIAAWDMPMNALKIGLLAMLVNWQLTCGILACGIISRAQGGRISGRELVPFFFSAFPMLGVFIPVGLLGGRCKACVIQPLGEILLLGAALLLSCWVARMGVRSAR